MIQESLAFEKLGFTYSRRALEEAVQSGIAPGFVCAVWSPKRPNTPLVHFTGQRQLEPIQAPMTLDTIFDLSSVTKIFATTALTARLVERGWIRWDQEVRSLIPEYPWPKITIAHLLSHTAGYVAWKPLYETLKTRFFPKNLYEISVSRRQSAMRELVFSEKPVHPPGTHWEYSDFSSLVLGFALENITALPLDEAVKKWVWEPWGISRAWFFRTTLDPLSVPDEVAKEKIAATENCPWRGGVLRGQVHDDNAWAMGGYGGHAGAFADIFSLVRFVQVHFSNQISPEILKAIWTPVSQPPGCPRTLGWDTPSGEHPSFGIRKAVGHLGFTGTSLWIDLEHQISVILLCNRVHPSRQNDRHKAFRSVFHTALYADLKAHRIV